MESGAVLKDLVRESELPEIGRRVLAAVNRSFGEDLVIRPVATRDEVRRRTAIALRALAEMLGDHRWSLPRALDHVYEALRTTLDGGTWAPPDRGMWAGDEGSRPPAAR